MNAHAFNRITSGGPLKIVGVPGSWAPVAMEATPNEVDVTNFGSRVQMRIAAGPPDIRLELVYLHGERGSDPKGQAVEDAPEDVKQAIAALFELDESLRANGKEAIVEVLDEPVDGSRFRIRAVDL